MPTFEITSPDGRKFRVNGPDGATKEQALAQVQQSLQSAPEDKQEAPVSAGGVAAEAGKGLLRGASDTARMIPAGLSKLLPPPLAQAVMQGLDAVAAPSRSQVQSNPQNNAEKMASTGSEIAGAVLAGGGGGTVGQVARNALLPAAGGVVGEQLGGETGKVLGALAPTAGQLAATGAGALKRTIANPETVQKNLDTFKQAGTQPDVAQATDSNFFRGLTNVVGRVPGGQGVIAKFRELEQEALGKSAKTGVSAESGGRAVKEGITGDGGFLDRTKGEWLKLDNAVATKIPQGSAFAPTNTVKALDELTTPAAGAEKTTGGLVNPTIAKIKENIAADLQANNGQMPFEALRALRTKVGSMLDDSLVSGVPGGELKKLYGGLSKDLEAAATDAGAGKEFARQSAYYKARMERIENTLDSVLGKGKAPEDIFKSISPTDVDSVNKLRRVMRSLEPEERQVVSNAVVNRLGRASPGKQDATGDKFSSETFLTNWSRINDNAKSQLFSDPAMRSKLDAIAKVSGDIREGKAPFGNPSGTGQAATAAGVYGSVPVAAGMAMTGNVGAAAATLAVSGSLIAGANIGAKMLTSPKVVDWLAKSSKVSTPEQMTAQLGRLAVIYNETKDANLKQELSDYSSSIK